MSASINVIEVAPPDLINDILRQVLQLSAASFMLEGWLEACFKAALLSMNDK